MNWKAKATGDMTLSVVDETGFQILKIDMLKQNTMQAGNEGKKLMRSMNDLGIIANFSIQKYDSSSSARMYEGEEVSSLPWYCKYNPERRTLVVGNADHVIADRTFPKKASNETITAILQVIEKGIEELNRTANPFEG